MRSRLQGGSKFVDYLDELLELVMKADMDEHPSFNATLNKLKRVRVLAEQSVFMDSICMNAVAVLETLKDLLNDAAPFKMLDPPLKTSTFWVRGTSRSTESKAFRALMPLSYLLDVLEKSEEAHFASTGGIRADRRRLKEQNTVVYHVTDQCVSLMKWSIVGGPYIEVKTIELNLKYDCEMIRYMLAPPGLGKLNNEERRKTARSMIDTWSSVLLLEKTRQMNVNLLMPPANFCRGMSKTCTACHALSGSVSKCEVQSIAMGSKVIPHSINWMEQM